MPMVCHHRRMVRRGRLLQIMVTASLGVIAVVLAAVTDTWGLYLTAVLMVVVGVGQFKGLPSRQG